MPLLDVFRSDAFSMHSLTEAVDKLPYKPGRVGELGLFKNKPATTRVAYIEERQGALSLLPVKERGERNQATSSTNTRKMRPFDIPHVPQWRAVLAESLEGKRAFGSETETEVFSAIINDELAEMKNFHEATHEFHRIGALKGIVLDADGSTEIVNFFTEFGITQTEIDFNRYDSGTYDAAAPAIRVKTVAAAIRRAIRDALGQTRFTGIHALCGDNYFDYLVEHASVRGAYKNWSDAKMLQTTQVSEGEVFPFAGIEWENYRGSIGSVDFVGTNEAVIFPKGTDGVFIESPGPANWIETVNTRGQMIYAKQKVMDYDEGIELHTQSNVLYICTRPACLIKSSLVNTAPGS